MNISRPFILRPVATSLLMLAMLFLGMLSWRLLPVAALPQVEYPIIQVFTFHPVPGRKSLPAALPGRWKNSSARFPVSSKCRPPAPVAPR